MPSLLVLPGGLAIQEIFQVISAWGVLGLGLLQTGLTLLMVPTAFSAYAILQVLPFWTGLGVAVAGYFVALVLIYAVMRLLGAFNYHFACDYESKHSFKFVLGVRLSFVQAPWKDYWLAIAGKPVYWYLLVSTAQTAFSLLRQMLLVQEVLEDCRWWAVSLYLLLWLGADGLLGALAFRIIFS